MTGHRQTTAPADPPDRLTRSPRETTRRPETAGREGRRDGDLRKPPSGAAPEQPEGETGGPKGPEPTRYGDWEKGGRCFDF